MTMPLANDARDTDKFWLALALSLLLHAGLYYLVPYLQSRAVTPLERIEIVLDTALQPVAPAPAPTPPAPPPVKAEPVPEKPEPKPVVKPQPKREKPVETPPVLATEAPAAPQDYVVPVEPESVVETTPEPVSEPVVSEPAPVVSNTPAPAISSESVTTPSTSNPAVATQNSEPQEATAQEAWNGYGQLLYNLVGRNKNYPQIAIRRNWEGEVKIYARFILGKLVEASIVTSSGHQVLDDEALEMVHKAAGQLPVSGELARKSFTVTIPVAFQLFK